MLDFNLNGAPVTPVAARLRAMSVPFVLSSAYTQMDREGGLAFEGVINLSKPFESSRLVRLVRRFFKAG